MSWTVATHLTYLAAAVPLTVWVATTLSRNGRVFLEDVFDGDPELADAVNRLLVAGFYLLNLGFVLLYLSAGEPAASLLELLETVSVKVGWVTLLLGVVHVGNVYVFNAIRRRGRSERFPAMQLPMQPQPGYPPHPAPPYAGPAQP